ncbi:calcium-binding protein [Roseomonas stagni]|uniref:Calcium-binding protein n=1 Tax=Falsiroseomonas algicola TaxID=2716930 RepID=A0A6M1LGG7_9PROT|nr:calcium-binding protein [Falsiroseomonas algicola]NGM19478.1 calcium-binding protein [Falsiroseomonas algicola]
MTDKTVTPLDEGALSAVTGGATSGGNDSVRGSDAPNLIFGQGGNDTILAGGGNDTVTGGSDNDSIAGQSGNDNLSGDDGQDTMLGGEGNDTMGGGAGSDIIVGGRGADLLYGDGVNVSGGGSDQFHWTRGDGNDTIIGGAGTDVLVIEDTSLTLQALLAGIRTDAGSATPRIENGAINLTGVTGTLTIGGETLRFSELERLTVGPMTNFANR